MTLTGLLKKKAICTSVGYFVIPPAFPKQDQSQSLYRFSGSACFRSRKGIRPRPFRPHLPIAGMESILLHSLIQQTFNKHVLYARHHGWVIKTKQ